MAAGTDITHPGSAIEGVYKPLPLESLPLCTITENGAALDNSDFTSLEQSRSDREAAANGSTRSAPVGERHVPSVRRSVSTTLIETSLPSSNLVDDQDGESSNYSVGIPVVEYMPVIRSGGWMDIGIRSSMEDTHLRIDDLFEYAGSLLVSGDGPGAFYGVFDGHGGMEAASFVKEHLLTNILEDVAFPTSKDEALKNAFLQTDLALVDEDWASGTTALTAMVFGRTLLVANAGDCRAVLSKRGKAVEMSRDHKPEEVLEKIRIEAAGGYVDDGYLNGQLAVARALGDWRMAGVKEPGVVGGPLSAEPEVQRATLTEEDEFMIIGCDGLWDVFTSQNAVDFARRKLQEHNDPERCSRELVNEALHRHTGDNLTVVTVCFQSNPPPKPKGYVPRFRRSISAEGLKNLQDLLDGRGP